MFGVWNFEVWNFEFGVLIVYLDFGDWGLGFWSL